MEKLTNGLPESPARRAARIGRVGARYGFGFVFGRRFSRRRRRANPERIGERLRRSFEELGPTFAELGRFLSARRDLLPPGVARQLSLTSPVVRPVAPREARTIVERELDNTLERLFLSFEEAPVRSGVFTQSHRAVLPGERPALVVINRPGLRRDLLAMRPVADLARRRLGEQLPLDPSAAVAEFAAHAAQRRDMYFAAQTTRRMREIKDLGLRVPEVYRGYSTSRCITFEAPETGRAPERAEYRAISGSLVKLALEDGISFSDLAPERFVVGDGEIWLRDPTEVFTLDEERLRGVSEVLAATRREDTDGVVRSLPLIGSSTPKDPASLRRELRETIGSLGGPLWWEHSLSEVRDRGMEAFRRGGTRMNPEVALMVDSLVAAESLTGEASAGLEEAASAAERLISRYRDPRYIAARAARKLAQPDTYADYPRQVHALLEELKDGEIEVRFQHGGLDDIISKVDLLANRLVFALLIAALVIGSSMIGIFSDAGSRVLGVSVFGLIGFVIAAIMALLLLVGIIRSGRL